MVLAKGFYFWNTILIKQDVLLLIIFYLFLSQVEAS